MKTLLIVYDSVTGGTLQMARAAARGASAEPMARAAARGASAEPGLACRLLHAGEAGPEDVLAADGTSSRHPRCWPPCPAG